MIQELKMMDQDPGKNRDPLNQSREAGKGRTKEFAPCRPVPAGSFWCTASWMTRRLDSVQVSEWGWLIDWNSKAR